MGRDRLESLAERLRLYKPVIASTSELTSVPVPDPRETLRGKRAAVLICLFEGDGDDLRVILTKRSSKLSSHSGEVALPGGKREENDRDDVETALREAKEEIGLDPSLVGVVTILDTILTKVENVTEEFYLLGFVSEFPAALDVLGVTMHGVAVVPVVGILSDRRAFNPVPCAAEVEDIFDAPLEMFLKDENRRAERREWMGHTYLLHHFYHVVENKTFVIWALTAGILIKAASVVYERPPEFLEERPRFWNLASSENTAKM